MLISRLIAAKPIRNPIRRSEALAGAQGAMAIEYIIDDIARHLRLDPLDVRKRNFYSQHAGKGRDTTPYGQIVSDNIIHELVDKLEISSDYRARRAEVLQHNQSARHFRKGIALTPCKFGISFNLVHLNQAGAFGADLWRWLGLGQSCWDGNGAGAAHQNLPDRGDGIGHRPLIASAPPRP